MWNVVHTKDTLPLPLPFTSVPGTEAHRKVIHFESQSEYLVEKRVSVRTVLLPYRR